MNKLTDARALPRASAVCEFGPPLDCWEDGSVNRGAVEKKNKLQKVIETFIYEKV